MSKSGLRQRKFLKNFLNYCLIHLGEDVFNRILIEEQNECVETEESTTDDLNADYDYYQAEDELGLNNQQLNEFYKCMKKLKIMKNSGKLIDSEAYKKEFTLYKKDPAKYLKNIELPLKRVKIKYNVGRRIYALPEFDAVLDFMPALNHDKTLLNFGAKLSYLPYITTNPKEIGWCHHPLVYEAGK